MSLYVSDKKLFTIVLYSAFENIENLVSMKNIWKSPWVIGTVAAASLGLVGWAVSPIILTAIIHLLGLGTGRIAANYFGSWWMSLYGGMITHRSFISILQSIGTTGLETAGTYLSSSIGASIGIFIGAIAGSELIKYFSELELSEFENEILENFVQIEEQDNNTVIFTLMPKLLYNDTMLECFAEAFITCSPFANSKLFKFNFSVNNLSSSEEEMVNNIVYNSLINNFEKSRVKFIWECCWFFCYNLIGYELDLSGYKPSNFMINLLVEVWRRVNKDDNNVNKDKDEL